ncbi:hypothetical protein GCM10010532_013520 [Dactylosporangium siamense]|uniref:Uncharacterized protein n=1 Tax=Dactylosporangium siamense TaxID=685454 RepID=A0A919PEU5_9ACTN|nr:hypothetical protein Dsi01nite_002850 [Dactylosporangium siamense]
MRTPPALRALTGTRRRCDGSFVIQCATRPVEHHDSGHDREPQALGGERDPVGPPDFADPRRIALHTRLRGWVCDMRLHGRTTGVCGSLPGVVRRGGQVS